MTAVLVVTQGPLAGQRLELEGELVIGREGAAITIDDSELSRRHAAVRPVEGGIEIEDLGSLNGTYVNGRRIDAPTRLAGGDSIKLGQSVLELEAASAPATVMSAAPTPPTAAPAAAPAASGVPSEPFGTYAAPEGMGRRRGIASRQLLPMLTSWAAVAGTAVALAIYFADHPR
ncbi:MAG TPA: FHA domain-containing protein [Gaiellaceae bacterium]|nr:FHA domain-containing protein [Gaiellaceae bacterium]